MEEVVIVVKWVNDWGSVEGLTDGEGDAVLDVAQEDCGALFQEGAVLANGGLEDENGTRVQFRPVGLAERGGMGVGSGHRGRGE